MGKYAIELNNITMVYPGANFKANENVSLAIEEGTVLCLIGENGAGKSTLMNILYGLFEPTEGEIIIKGEHKVFHSSLDALKSNIGMVHQHFMLVEELSVLENIIIGFEPKKRFFVNKSKARDTITKIMKDNGMEIPLDEKVANLPVGIQQKVEIIKILYRGADILIFDEPTAVLTPQETQELFINVRKLINAGKTVVFITHKLNEVMEIADNIAIMRRGKNVGFVKKEDTTATKLAELMIGSKLPQLRERKDLNLPVIARIKGLTVNSKTQKPLLNNVNLNIRKGEIVGIAGISGNGQISLAEAITGIKRPDSGLFELNGQDFTNLTRKEKIQNGLCYIPFDRKKEGLNMEWSLDQNSIAGFHDLDEFLKSYGPLKLLNKNSIKANAEKMIEKFDIRTQSYNTQIASLSGGNQQKVVIGRETLVRKPQLLVAAEPTRGVDIGAISFIHDYILQLRNEGTGILLFSSDLDEIFTLSDTVLVMFEGELVCKFNSKEITKDELGLFMAGAKRNEVFYE
jgi:simple sugar transport system ATP-binding protein